MTPTDPWLTPAALAQSALYLDAYERLLGRPLFPRTGSLEADARLLFEAPYVAVSHGTESDPIFNYGNRTALALWEFSWAEFTQLPSRYSAEEGEHGEREGFLRAVRENGYATGYSGIRASKSGRRFRILDVTVWNLVDASGFRHGQGATYARWEFL